MGLFPKIVDCVSTLKIEIVSNERKAILKPLIEFIQAKVDENKAIRINFICTHNSRRSHLLQIWTQALAYHFNIRNVSCYSGGTESTALFPMVAETLKNAGFEVKKLSKGNNIIYSIKYAVNEHPIIGFSKKWNDDFNPKNEFAAIMTCSEADGACPFISGAEKRIPITFEDPKLFDNTSEQTEKYNERSLQIASELFYVFSQIQS